MTLMEKLTREIERVTILRAAYVLTDNTRGTNSVPIIAIMAAAIETAHAAAGSGNPIHISAAISTLARLTE